MSICPDLSDPMDDSKGASTDWGKWTQDKKAELVLTFDKMQQGTCARDITVSINSLSLRVAVRNEDIVSGRLLFKVIYVPSILYATITQC